MQTVPKLNDMLRAGQVLQFLDLRSTNLTDAGLSLLCDGLVHCQALFFVNLAKNDITHSGIEQFGPVMASSTIQELDLSLNPLGSSGIKCLAENLWVKKPSYNSLLPDETPHPTSASIEVNNAFGGQQRKAVEFIRGDKCQLQKLNLSETKL